MNPSAFLSLLGFAQVVGGIGSLPPLGRAAGTGANGLPPGTPAPPRFSSDGATDTPTVYNPVGTPAAGGGTPAGGGVMPFNPTGSGQSLPDQIGAAISNAIGPAAWARGFAAAKPALIVVAIDVVLIVLFIACVLLVISGGDVGRAVKKVKGGN